MTNTELAAPGAATTNPPGPSYRWWGFPLLGAMRRDYLGFVEGLQREHGDLTFMRIGAERAYDLFDPALVRAALVDHADHLIRWERGIEIFEQLMGQSVLVTEGATWQRQRRMLQPAFAPKRVAGYATLMVDAAASALDAALPAGRDEARVDMDALFTGVSMDVILRTLFGATVDPAESRRASAAVQVMSACALREMFWPMTLPDWLPLPGKAAKRRALRELRSLLNGHIAARRARPAAGDDLLAMLLSLRDDMGNGAADGASGGSGAALSDAEIFDQCMVTFQAGHETSATALLWWSRLLAEHPDAAARVRAEVDAVLGDRMPAAADMAALPFLTATLKEAMRLYPPIAAIMTRRTTADIELGGHAIPRGAMLRITPWVIQRDPRLFERPKQFMPERFLPDAAAALPRGAAMPFGTGPRVCIGQHFAMLEMVLIAAMLLQRYELQVPDDGPRPEPVLHVTLRPAGGMSLVLRRRR